ncbi:hypothetical protein [Streptomyces mirabilis]|uniref:hypothetical protein n=1 Tax=Streptomyces mirabilis TaxID=68239 RepID=UPI00331C1DBE
MSVLRGAAAEPGAAPVTATAGIHNSAEQTASHATTEIPDVVCSVLSIAAGRERPCSPNSARSG